MNKTKVCSKCKIQKIVSKFYKSKSSKSDYRSNCKCCMSETMKKYYLKYKEKIKESQKKWYEKHKVKVLKYRRKWIKENPEKRKKHTKKYRETHSRRIKESNERYLRTHPWQSHHNSADQRCNNSKSDSYKYYGGRGIQMLMTISDFKYLWFRDKAYLMEQPSIDRKNSDGNYISHNCQFIEMEENTRKSRKKGYEPKDWKVEETDG